MPGKKEAKKGSNKRITAKFYKFPKAFRRKTSKKRPKSKSPSLNECPICLDPLTPNNLAILNCGHKFHFRCILKDVTKARPNKQCPICRAQVGTPPRSQTPPRGPALRLEDLGPINDDVLNQQQLGRLRRVMDPDGNFAYLDERGIFNDEGMLYDANGEQLGYYEDVEAWYIDA
jgi:hypothetical protein